MKIINRFFFIVALFSLVLSCKSDAFSSNSDATEKERYSYALGKQIGQNLKNQGVDIDVKVFSQALKDVIEGRKSLMTDGEMREALQMLGQALQKQQGQRSTQNLKEGKDFLVKNRQASGVKETKTGLQYKVLKRGAGRKPKPTDKVVVHYKGQLLNGQVFDSSYQRNTPAEFKLNQVIRGWQEGLALMKVGAKFTFYIPSELAYGPQDRPGIPGNSVLVFEVELLAVK